MQKYKQLLLAFIPTALLVTGCVTTSPSQSTSGSVAPQTIYMYAYQDRDDPKDHVKHSLFIIGDATTGSVRYTAAAFKDGARYSLATSGNGKYSISGSEITINAGGLNGTGTIVPGKSIAINGMNFTFAMKM